MELKGASKEGNNQRSFVTIWVGDDEVLATCFTNNTRVGAIRFEVVRHVSPHLAENRGGACEVNAGKHWVGKHRVANHACFPWNEVDDASWKASVHHQAHQEVVRNVGISARLPNTSVAHDGGAGREVCRNAGEVERCYGEDEAFKRAYFARIPHTWWRNGWLQIFVDLSAVICVEAPEVN